MVVNKLKDHHLVLLGLVAAALLIAGLILNARISALKKKNLKNKETLTMGLSDFDNQNVAGLKQETRDLKARIVNLAAAFDPKERWFRKDYDLSIHFVEELGKLNQALKNKAAEKNLSYQELGFKEKLPSESEAFYLLSQLWGLREIVDLGLDYSVNFSSINPEGIEDAQGLPEIKLAKSRIGLVCPAQGLIDFIIQLNGITPRPYTESLSLKSQDSSFEMDMTIDNTIVDLNWKDKAEFPVSSRGIERGDEGFIRALRGANPFMTFIPQGAQAEAGLRMLADKPKIQQRFVYQGKATLKSREVAVIEDRLNQETHFLAQGETLQNFMLKKIFSDRIILESIAEGKEIIIKREEESDVQ